MLWRAVCQRQTVWIQYWGDGRKNGDHQGSGTGSSLYKYLGVDESNGIQHSTICGSDSLASTSVE